MRIARAPGVFWDGVDDETVVCDPVSGELYRLNAIAAFLWSACDDLHGRSDRPTRGRFSGSRRREATSSGCDPLRELHALQESTARPSVVEIACP
jgi:hypothetical protein